MITLYPYGMTAAAREEFSDWLADHLCDDYHIEACVMDLLATFDPPNPNPEDDSPIYHYELSRHETTHGKPAIFEFAATDLLWGTGDE